MIAFSLRQYPGAPRFRFRRSLMALGMVAGASIGSATELHVALRRGDLEAIRTLLDAGANPDARDATGNTPLHLAALRSDLPLVETLLSRGASANAVNDAGATPLHYGVASESIAAALLVHGATVDPVTTLGATPLVIASSHGNSYAVVRRLVDAGANINHRQLTPRGTPAPFGVLANAIRAGDRRTVGFLIERGAEVNPAAGLSPLTTAALTGDVETAKLLLAHKADVNPRTSTGALPLPAAALRRSPDLVRLLLDHGADPHATWIDRRRTPPVVFGGYSDTGDTAILRLLRDHGADINATDEIGDSAISYALKRGPDTPLVKLLQELGASLPTPTARVKPIPTREVPASLPSKNAMIRDRVQRAIDLIQPSSKAFLANPFVSEQRRCTSCHHQALPAVGLSLARQRDLRVDELELGRSLHAIEVELIAQAEAARQMSEPVPNSRVTIGYDLDALHALGYQADDTTDAMARHILDYQDQDGSWRAFVPRGPMEDQVFVGTAWSIRAIQLYPPGGRERDVDHALARARAWLHSHPPALPNDRVFHLLGLAWANETPDRMRTSADELIARQREDGGWSQLPTLESDAWATGSTLFALHQAGIATSHEAYQRGVDFLLRTQFDDGSWWVRSRSWPTQPHFDAQFPHGKDQWISAAGTAWAMIALLLPLEATRDARSLPDAHAIITTFTTTAPPAAVARSDSTELPDTAALPPPIVSFHRDIKPLLERSCFECHTGKRVKGGFNLGSRELALKGGSSGERAIVPGKGAESILLRYVADEIEDLEMPPLSKRTKLPPLTPEEIMRLRAWIDAGAPWDHAELTAPPGKS